MISESGKTYSGIRKVYTLVGRKALKCRLLFTLLYRHQFNQSGGDETINQLFCNGISQPVSPVAQLRNDEE